MTYQQPQPPPYVHPGPVGMPPAPVPPARKVPTVLLVILAVLGLVVVLGLIGALLSGGDKPKAAAPAAKSTATVATPTTEAAAAEPVAPGPANFTAKPKIIEKNCFGSAGCNVTLRIDLATSVTPEPGVSWLVVYEIHGVEDGPEIGNLTVTGDSYESSEEHVGVASSKSKITIKVVSVEIA